MGLSAPRKRVKLSHDPNNTKWTRDTGGFGHKILIAQGWQPGEILGAKNAAHTEFHTAANAAHIRVVVKDDSLGLGAKNGSGLAEGECTGLDEFQSLLGRLNGKYEDELAKEQKSREDLKRAIYTERRFGSIRFVQGGYLIGDKIQELVDKEDRLRHLEEEASGTSTNTVVENDPNENSEPQASEILLENRRKKKRKDERQVVGSTRAHLSTLTAVGNEHQETSPTQPRKSKKKRRQTDDDVRKLDGGPEPGDHDGKRKSKKKSKAEADLEPLVEDVTPVNHDLPLEPPIPALETRSSTPQSLLGGRHAVRSRYIAQKRLAVLDTDSLNQIFMIKQ